MTVEQCQLLDELLQEHTDTIVEHIVLFRQHLRTMFNESDSFTVALEHLATLILDGWADVSTTFSKIMAFLQEHFTNICTYLRVPNVQRNSLSECTVIIGFPPLYGTSIWLVYAENGGEWLRESGL